MKKTQLMAISTDELKRGIRFRLRAGGSLLGGHSSRKFDLAWTRSRMAKMRVTVPKDMKAAVHRWPDTVARAVSHDGLAWLAGRAGLAIMSPRSEEHTS